MCGHFPCCIKVVAVALILHDNTVQGSFEPIYLSTLLWVWVGLPHTDDHTHTHTNTLTQTELPTTVLIVKTVYQSSGEIKGEKEWGVGGSGRV